MVVVVIHGGAGLHGENAHLKYKKPLTLICDQIKTFAQELQQQRKSSNKDDPSSSKNKKRKTVIDEKKEDFPVALLAAQYGLALLENCPLLNAGIAGSNACLDGTIECDAALMCLDTFGSVGAVPMCRISSSSSSSLNANETLSIPILSRIIKEPSLLALEVWKTQYNGPDRIGRVPPLTVVGPQAHAFGMSRGLPSIPSSEAESFLQDSQRQRYGRHLSSFLKCTDVDTSLSEKKWDTNTKEDKLHKEDDTHMDTVGILVLDDDGILAAGTSSGGVSLKWPGRLSHASQFGSAVWASQPRNNGSQLSHGVGISATGTGEHIVLSQITSRLAHVLSTPFHHDEEAVDSCDSSSSTRVRECVEQVALNNPLLNPSKNPKKECHVGAIYLVMESSSDEIYSGSPHSSHHCIPSHIEIGWFHTTQSLVLTYSASSLKKSVFRLSRQQSHGCEVFVGCESIAHSRVS